jgi:hypothetical protein
LSIVQSNNQIMLNWPSPNDWLQAAPALGPQSVPFLWTTVGTTPATSATLPLNQGAQFFRLVVSPGAPPPTELALQNLSDTNGNFYFELNWNAVAQAASYNLYMATVPGVNSGNYMSLPGGMAFTGLTNLYADIPDVPDGIFTPALATATPYYFVVNAVTSNGLFSAESNPASGILGPSAEVEGRVFADLTVDGSPTMIFLPNVLLTLVNQSNPALSNSVTSDVSGDFVFPPMPAGNYNLCWQANGFTSACSNGLTLGNTGYYAGAIQLYPAGGSGTLYGKVTFQDDSPAYNVDGVFGINVQPVVVLTSNQVVLASAPVNASGQYVMAGVPEAASLQVGVAVENISVVSNVNTFTTGEADLVLPSTPPEIQSVIATSNGVPVYNVAPATTVQVTVTATGHNLEYAWFDTNGPAYYPNSSNINWTLPAAASGFQYLWARVSDGSGGYAVERVELSVSPYAFIDGTVLGSDTGAPLTGALVQLNGQATTTDTNGFFSFELYLTNQYDLTISASNSAISPAVPAHISVTYAPMSRTYLEPVSDQTYVLLAITNLGPFCPSGSDLVWVTNCANGVIASIPVYGLLDTNNNSYSGCFFVSLDTLDPCNPANGFAGGDLETNDAPLQPYSLVNIGVTDPLGNPLHLAPGASVNIFTPISASCLNTNAPLATNAAIFAQTNTANDEWSPISTAELALNTNCVPNYAGYDGQAGALGLLCVGAPVPPATLGPLILRFIVDDSLHIPLTVGYFLDNGGKPGQQWGDYQIINYNLEGVKFSGLTPNQVIWIEILNMRQSPGNYYGNGNAQPLPTGQKDVIQVLKFTAPAQTPANDLKLTLGLGLDVDNPVVAPRGATLQGLKPASLKNLGENFLTVRSAEEGYNANTDYYNRIDAGGKKTTFAAWQLANGWPQAGLGAIGGANGYGLYFNANDLGAGRRTGMNIFTEGQGANKGQSVAYYVATYATLAGAVQDEQQKLVNVPADTQKTGNLKYVVCMEYSLTYNTTGAAVKGGRFIKFYAFGADGNRTGVVPNESRAQPLIVPYVCMNCHGGSGITLHQESPTNEFGDVRGQFVAFDMANYTFSSAYPPNQGLNQGAFNKLNQGLLIGQATMPQKTLVPLIQALIKNNGTTSDSSALANWGANPNAPTAAETTLYNNVYAVSCRSCHVTQCTDEDPKEERAYNFTTAAGFLDALSTMVGAVPGSSIAGSPYMPHAQRSYGIYWGSATAMQLQNQGTIAGTPAVISQPALSYGVTNSDYFTVPVK